ncbi:type I methionyl aminopeptidase [Candidatus Dependentiae bacterium]|nr:type I methionyl aminopeptidase [Candidatus Dependentiae bacterium]
MVVKTIQNLQKMREAGRLLADIFESIPSKIQVDVSTAALDSWIEGELIKRQLVSQSKGYRGYRHVSCISVNNVVVHGVPSDSIILQDGDLVKVDVCAAWQGYCADMARCFFVGNKPDEKLQHLVTVAYQALDKGIAKAVEGNRLFDISAAIQEHVEKFGYGVVRDFAGHGIGKNMHENPDVPNFGIAGTGMRLKAGMTFAIEPMITQESYEIYIDSDHWTVKTKDGKYAAHVEDTVVVGKNGPEILTRL